MDSLKASQLRAVSASNSSSQSDPSRKRNRPDQLTAESKLKMKKAKAKQENVIRQMSASVNASHASELTKKSSGELPRNSNANFKALGTIVDLMKDRHKENLNFPLTFAEIQDALHEKFGRSSFYISPKEMAWLKDEALPNNPKIHMDEEKRFTYKPPYSINNKKQLLRLLKNYDLHGEGGLLVEDIEESLPREKVRICAKLKL